MHILLWLCSSNGLFKFQFQSWPDHVYWHSFTWREWMNEYTRVHLLFHFFPIPGWLLLIMLNNARKTWVNPPHLNWPQQLRLMNITTEHPEAPWLTWRMETEGSPGSDFTLLLLVAPMPNSFFCSCNKNFSYGSSSLE